MRLCGFWAYFRIFMRLFLLCGYAVTRIISFLDLPLFSKIPLILPNLSHFSLTIGFTFLISLAIQSIRSICESLFITLIIFLRILPTNAQLFCYITYIFLLFCVNYRFIQEALLKKPKKRWSKCEPNLNQYLWKFEFIFYLRAFWFTCLCVKKEYLILPNIIYS